MPHRTDNKENGALWQANVALEHAAYGNPAEARQAAAQALKLLSGQSREMRLKPRSHLPLRAIRRELNRCVPNSAFGSLMPSDRYTPPSDRCSTPFATQGRIGSRIYGVLAGPKSCVEMATSWCVRGCVNVVARASTRSFSEQGSTSATSIRPKVRPASCQPVFHVHGRHGTTHSHFIDQIGFGKRNGRSGLRYP